MRRFLRRILRDGRDVPLGGDASSRFLPGITGLMVYLAVVALAVTMVLADTSLAWRRGLSGKLTVQIIPEVGDRNENLETRTRAATELLLGTPGVLSAKILTDDQLSALLAPWIGTETMTRDLPIPSVIDVTLAANVTIDTRALAVRLATAVPGASLDDHAIWLDRLLALIAAIEAVALVALALIGIAGVSIVVFTTRSGLAIHEDVVGVLHMIGARDSYIARQFQTHVLRLAIKGGVFGFAFAAATIAILGMITEKTGIFLLPDMSLSILQWIVLGVLPLVAAAIGTATARVTVMRAIGRMI